MIERSELRDELVARMGRDQAANRAAYPDGGQVERDVLERVLVENNARMQEIVDEHGWPGWRLVGVDGAQAAWLLVQHADREPVFQKRCLALVEEAMARGDVDPEHFAYLYDRVAVAEQRPQRYGTQFGDDRQPRPIEEEGDVDARRASVGLAPLADYRRQMWEHYGPPR